MTAPKKTAAAKAAAPVVEKAPVEKKAAALETTVEKKEAVAPKAVAEKKETAAPKAAEAKKAAPAKKAPAKKAAATKAEIKSTLFVQFAGNEYTEKTLVAAAKKAYVALGNKVADIKTIELYVKTEENVAYYTVNGIGSPEYKIEL